MQKREVGVERSAPVAVLQRAREIINQGWARLSSAYDANGKPVGWNHEDADRFCLSGAVKRAGMELGMPTHEAFDAIRENTRYTGCGSSELGVIRWNDHVADRPEDIDRLLVEVIENLEG